MRNILVPTILSLSLPLFAEDSTNGEVLPSIQDNVEEVVAEQVTDESTTSTSNKSEEENPFGDDGGDSEGENPFGDEEKSEEVPVEKPIATKPKEERLFSLNYDISSGYDNNVVLASDTTATPLGKDSYFIDLGLEGKAKMKLGFLNLTGSVSADIIEYSELPEYQTLRVGALVTGRWNSGNRIHSTLLAYNLFYQDWDKTVTAVTANTSLSFVVSEETVRTFSLTGQSLDYDSSNDADGYSISLGAQEWFLLEPSNARKKVVGGVKLSYMQAEESYNSYYSFRPSLALDYSFKFEKSQRILDLSSKLSLEYRKYLEANTLAGETDSDLQTTIRYDFKANYWLDKTFAIGLKCNYSFRTSDYNSNEYDKTIIAATATRKW